MFLFPSPPFQTVKSGDSYTFRCEGRRRGVTWRMPVDATEDLRSRVALTHRSGVAASAAAAGGGARQTVHVSELRLSDLNYLDTGTFVCTYNGTGSGPDAAGSDSVDNSTRVHLYVEDERHLLRTTGVEFLQFVQSSRGVLPCQPTNPAVNVTLYRSGAERPVDMARGIRFDPRVSWKCMLF